MGRRHRRFGGSALSESPGRQTWRGMVIVHRSPRAARRAGDETLLCAVRLLCLARVEVSPERGPVVHALRRRRLSVRNDGRREVRVLQVVRHDGCGDRRASQPLGSVLIGAEPAVPMPRRLRRPSRAPAPSLICSLCRAEPRSQHEAFATALHGPIERRGPVSARGAAQSTLTGPGPVARRAARTVSMSNRRTSPTWT